MDNFNFEGIRIDNGEKVYGDLIRLCDGRRFIVDNRFGACIDDKGNFINTGAPFVCEVKPESIEFHNGLINDSKGISIRKAISARAMALTQFRTIKYDNLPDEIKMRNLYEAIFNISLMADVSSKTMYDTIKEYINNKIELLLNDEYYNSCLKQDFIDAGYILPKKTGPFNNQSYYKDCDNNIMVHIDNVPGQLGSDKDE